MTSIITGFGATALQRASQWVHREFEGVSLDGPKVFTYPIGDKIHAHVAAAAAADPGYLAEEHATYELIRYLCADVLHTDYFDEADMVFVPLHAAIFDLDIGIELSDVIGLLETLDSGKPHLICSIGDYHPRSPGRHFNPYSVPGDPKNPWAMKYSGDYDWLDTRFIWMSPESTLDLHPNDIGLPILIPMPHIAPHQVERELFFSFAGQLGYSKAPLGHVRGGQRDATWAQLRSDACGMRSFVGSVEAMRREVSGVSVARKLPGTSVFTLCPAGWGRWSFRLFEAIASGSIPVILSDYYIKPFSEHIAWDSFSITIPESDLARVPTILKNLSDARIGALQAALAKHQHHFTAVGIAKLVCTRLAAHVHRL